MTRDPYYDIQRISNSGMSSLKKSPAHYQWALKNPQDTEAMRFGRLVHTAILEPQLLNITPFDLDRRTKEGRSAFQSIIDSGFEPIKPDEYAALMSMRDAVNATGLIEGDFEVPMLWTDADSGAVCKGKADIINRKTGMIWDVKTTEDAIDFAYSVKKYDYDRQAAFYLDGATENRIDVSGFGWIVVEKKPPHGVMVYVASSETIASGRAKYKPLCSLYAQCCFTGEWPSYSSQPTVI